MRNSPCLRLLTIALAVVMLAGNVAMAAPGNVNLPGGSEVRPLRMAQIDLDMIWDEDSQQFEENIRDMLDYLKRSNVNVVFLEAYADDEGSGDIESVYFWTRRAPVKQAVFAQVVKRLHAADIKVFAWLSTIAGQWLTKDHPEDAIVAYDPANKGWYKRATPFSPRVRSEVIGLVGDLAAQAEIDGIIFNDDLYMNDYEDFSPASCEAFRSRFGQELTPEALKDPVVMRQWTELKTKALNELSLAMVDEVRRYRPAAQSARNIYPAVILEDDAQEWLAQNYDDYLALYDYTVIMAYPRMEQVKNPGQWLHDLAVKALGRPQARQKAIFKLQGLDWSTDKWIGKRELSQQVSILRSSGVLHLGYYPVDCLNSKRAPLPFE